METDQNKRSVPPVPQLPIRKIERQIDQDLDKEEEPDLTETMRPTTCSASTHFMDINER